MKINKKEVDDNGIERVHRSGLLKFTDRKIIAKFTCRKEKEYMKNNVSNLKGTNFFVRGQFLPDMEVSEATDSKDEGSKTSEAKGTIGHRQVIHR